MTQLPGVFTAKKKDGSLYYRASVTYLNKHISLGSYPNAQQASHAYNEAVRILRKDLSCTPEQFSSSCPLSFDKWICLLNFRDNGIYIRNPIYLRKTYFEYYLSRKDVYLFAIDDLFYYSEHKLMKRGEHLFVSEYGMQTSILSRYGIHSHSVAGTDYQFKNGNTHDLRYENICVINPYHGVRQICRNGKIRYQARIHVRSSYVIGTYKSAELAAIAYNKAIDILRKAGCERNYPQNFLEQFSGKTYADLYETISISDTIKKLTFG